MIINPIIRSCIAAAAVALIAAAALYLLPIAKDSSVRADAGVTTKRTAEAAGATVLPTDPKLKIEPK
ncbi:MAG: hypothetical protein JOY90_16310 [Bradyrhizobium sp.]|nr:hypothetical protein [Bradyrhizobium sp.]